MGVFNSINGTGNLIIYSGADTTGPVLQSTAVSVLCASGNCSAVFPVSVSVTAGQVYCFRFIPGAGMPDPYGLQVEVPGTYPGGEMAIIDPSGVYFTGFDQVFKTFVETSTGIIEISYPELKMFPNPFVSSTTILFNEAINEGVLLIYNLHGTLIKKYENISGVQFILEKRELSNGSYFIQLYENILLLSTGRMVISE
jgi:hypothetical protein